MNNVAQGNLVFELLEVLGKLVKEGKEKESRLAMSYGLMARRTSPDRRTTYVLLRGVDRSSVRQFSQWPESVTFICYQQQGKTSLLCLQPVF